MRVIGTAGHVDHGKSTLVEVLTGVHPDRLKEEREREMTIDLGFGWLTLPNGEPVGVVDVPGHRDFIENMLAGVGGIDAALFVVAADEGVMPQTREHLAILDLLEVRNGVVALTKSDLAESPEWLELVVAEVAEVLEGTVLAGAPIVPVSARNGQGIPQLLQALQDCLLSCPPRPDLGRARLPVDRVFTISGFGTVITGTLSGGSLVVGQEVEILPRGLRARIRGLQTHKRKIERAVPGSRVAINLSGISTDEVCRGDVVATPGLLQSTEMIDVRFRYLADAGRPLTHNAEVKFFSGAAEVPAHIRLLGDDDLAPGAMAWLQIRLAEPVAVDRGDHYILRLASPGETIGGGVIVDAHPGHRHRRFKPEVIARLEKLAQGTPAEILFQTLSGLGVATVGQLLEAAGMRAEEARPALAELIEQGQVLVLARSGESDPWPDLISSAMLLTTVATWQGYRQAISAALQEYHQANPLRPGMSREELKSRLRLDARSFSGVLGHAVSLGLLVDDGTTVRLPGFQVTLTPVQERRVADLLAAFRRDPFNPPSVREATAQLGPEVFNVLLDRRVLVQLNEDVLFLAETLITMRQAIEGYLGAYDSITVAQARDLFGTSRKYMLAFLEYLDRQKVTARHGDIRVRSGQMPPGA